MVSIDLEELLQYAKRVEGKTVVLTGQLPALSVNSMSY
jgi:NAD-dependent DNA ligase